VLAGLLVVEYYRGRFAECDELLPAIHDCAVRAGHRGARFIQEWMDSGISAARSGSLRDLLARSERFLETSHFTYLSRTAAALCRLYLGETDRGLAQLEEVVVELPENHWFNGMPEGNLFAANALVGRHDRARALVAGVVPHLPVPGRRNIQGAFYALDALVTGLAHLGDRERRAAAYPLTLEYIRTGQIVAGLVAGPSNPQIVAALASAAAGLAEKSREHFETALRQAREVPVRIMEPTVEYWYGRALSSAADPAERARGRAMVEAALSGFRALGMVPHAGLAERFLRGGLLSPI
jgi:hypothetical protein